MAKIFSRLEHLYVTKETSWGTAVSPSATDATRHIKCSMNNTIQLLRRRDKTGSRSQTQGVKGRSIGRWSFESSLYPSGTAGTVPDFDVLLQMIFGGPASGGVYTLSDSILSGDIWSYRTMTAGTPDQRVSVGSIAQNFQFNLGQDIAEWTVDGQSIGVLSSAKFGSYTTIDAPLKAGLGSFPSEPGAQTYVDGGAIAGFTGSITVDGQTLAQIRTATIKGNTGNVLVEDQFGNYYPGAPEGDVRNYTVSFTVYDDDTVGLEAIKEAAFFKTPISSSLTVGTVAGHMFTFGLAGIQLEEAQLDDSGRSWVNNFGDSPVFGSSVTALDELTLTCG